MGNDVFYKTRAFLADVPDAVANITAGTKAHACALARIRALALWSLRQDLRRATPLGGGDGLDLRAPGIDIQARVCGGRLLSAGQKAAGVPEEQRYALVSVAKLLVCAHQEGHPKSDRLCPLRCSRGNIEMKKGAVTVVCDGRRSSARLRPGGGFWLEQVTAAALVAAGAEDVRLNTKWEWPKEARIEQVVQDGPSHSACHKDEADVLCRLGHRYFLFSCKLGGTFAAASREAEAEAVRGVGRFTIPIVVRPFINPAKIAERLGEKSAAAALDLTYLAEPDRLRQALDRIGNARRTLGVDRSEEWEGAVLDA
jgi:hypothetical protein